MSFSILCLQQRQCRHFASSPSSIMGSSKEHVSTPTPAALTSTGVPQLATTTRTVNGTTVHVSILIDLTACMCQHFLRIRE